MSAGFFRKYIKVSNLPVTIRVKWSAEVLNEGVVPIPKKIMRFMPKIFSGKENGLEKMLVLLAIADFKRPNYIIFPSAEYLAFTAGLDAKRFMAILDEMRQEGYVEYKKVDDRLDVEMTGFYNKVLELDKKEVVKVDNETPF
ncbi:MAG: hypothetical protein ACK4VI_05980 [Alphaproteobacteria bacterium]